MNESRISTPVRKIVDDWKIRFRKGWVMFSITLLRSRDPEISDGVCHFYATLDEVSKENEEARQEIIANTVDLKEDSLKSLRNKLLDTLKVLDSRTWKRVVVISVLASKSTPEQKIGNLLVEGGERARMVGFAWAESLQSEDGQTYKQVKGDRPFITNRPLELLRDGFWSDDKDVQVFPYSEEIVATCKRLDERFDQLTVALRELVQVQNAEKLFSMFQEPGSKLLT